MGGGFYDGDVATRARSTNRNVFTYQGYGIGDAAAEADKRSCHPNLNIKGKLRESRDSADHPDTTPIVVAFDVTRSRGDDAKIMYSKLPMLIGQIMMRGYVPDPVICFAAIGDATSGDQAPIQVGQFESDNRLDENLSWIWIEEGGGGTGQESYELMAYYLARKMKQDNVARGKKGYCFFIGDEGFYPEVSKDQVQVWIGDHLEANLPSGQIFRELQEQFHVFFIYPQKSWESRVSDIDAEIKQRVEQAGGMHGGVDIRCSLMWNTFDDLDLHAVTPNGEHIYFSNKVASCGGSLDVDRNAGGGQTRKPVENIRWAKGTAPEGKYHFYVQNFAFHEDDRQPVSFRVEIEINGRVHHVDGVASPNMQTGGLSDIKIGDFEFHREKQLSKDELYEGYNDTVIKNQWKTVIPEERLLIIEDPKAIVDVLLGALVVTEKTAYSLDDYIRHMEERGQTEKRRAEVRQALENLSGASITIPEPIWPSTTTARKSKGKTTRL